MYKTLFLIILISLMALPTQASRIALLIGNGDYQNVPKLANPVNDAKDMEAVLKTLGFQVTVKLNTSKEEMKNAVREFGQRLHNGDVALFYYSGHGLQSDNSNYLVPREADIKSDAEIEFEAFNASRVFREMKQANEGGVNIMILDACRDNPFQTNSKNIKKGLAEMRSPVGSLLAYATAPNLASYGDSKQRNSIYTKYLLKGLRQKHFLSVLELLTEVTSQVVRETEGEQVPWQSASLTQRFCFGRCGASSIPDLLRTCEQHFQANRLTTGEGGTAFACYTEVLEKDKNNAEALAGLEKIEAKYVTWIKGALCNSKKKKALEQMEGLRKVNPESQELAAFDVLLQTPPDKVFRDHLQDGSQGPEMVWIAGDSFRMGDLQEHLSVLLNEANPFGLYDTVGNVWEWCADSWHGSYEGAPTDGHVWSGANENIRVQRGGSWDDDPRNARTANRSRYTSAERVDSFGFRVVSSVAWRGLVSPLSLALVPPRSARRYTHFTTFASKRNVFIATLKRDGLGCKPATLSVMLQPRNVTDGLQIPSG